MLVALVSQERRGAQLGEKNPSIAFLFLRSVFCFSLSQSVEGEVQNLVLLYPAAESDSSVSTSRFGKSVRLGYT